MIFCIGDCLTIKAGDKSELTLHNNGDLFIDGVPIPTACDFDTKIERYIIPYTMGSTDAYTVGKFVLKYYRDTQAPGSVLFKLKEQFRLETSKLLSGLSPTLQLFYAKYFELEEASERIRFKFQRYQINE